MLHSLSSSCEQEEKERRHRSLPMRWRPFFIWFSGFLRPGQRCGRGTLSSNNSTAKDTAFWHYNSKRNRSSLSGSRKSFGSRASYPRCSDRCSLADPVLRRLFENFTANPQDQAGSGDRKQDAGEPAPADSEKASEITANDAADETKHHIPENPFGSARHNLARGKSA